MKNTIERVPGSLEIFWVNSSGMLPPASLLMVFPLQTKVDPPLGPPVPARK